MPSRARASSGRRPPAGVSDNKYSLLGGLRAASQDGPHEVTLGLTLVGAMMLTAPRRLTTWSSGSVTTPGGSAQPLGFILFFTAAVAELKRIPFDIPEGESEVVAGYFTEYCGMKFAMFMFAEYIAMVSAAAVMAALFWAVGTCPSCSATAFTWPSEIGVDGRVIQGWRFRVLEYDVEVIFTSDCPITG